MSSVESPEFPKFEVPIPMPGTSPIFVVDDEPGIRLAIGEFLKRKGYPVQAFENAEKCLAALSKGSAALLIADIRMPGMDGVEMAERALGMDPDLAVIMLTAVRDPQTAITSMKLGAADYLMKPVELPDLSEAVERALRGRSERVYRRKMEAWVRQEVRSRTAGLEEKTRGLEEFTVRMLNVLTRVMELKDPYLKGHSERVADLALQMGRVLGFNETQLEDLRLAALLHDLGQVAVRESVIQKKGGLTKDEFASIKNSVRVGAQLLEPFEHLAKVREIMTHYRERMNGSGYPDGLKGDSVPLESRVLGLAEAFDALVSERPHRPAYSKREAVETLRGTVGVWFEARVFGALERLLSKAGG
ncbi:MAG: HD domain-containing phosphohydrolase [Gemmatimonadota bacterium]